MPANRDDLDTSSRHSLLVEREHADEVLTSHFYHAGEFWRALIPLNATQSIFGQAFNFSPVRTRPGPRGPEIIRKPSGQPWPKYSFINHLQCRILLDRPVTLFALDDLATEQPVHQIRDFVYSVEAVGPPGVPFNFRNAISGVLFCAHRFLSTEEMVFERVVVQRQYVWESAALRLNEDQRNQALRAAIDRSTQAGMKERYYLYRCCGTNNCTSNPFQLVDRCAQYNWRQWLGAWLYRLPLNPRLYLRIRGLDSDPDDYRLVREEFANFIADAETQKRKRRAVKAEIAARRAARDR